MASITAAPWRSKFLSQISNMPMAAFALSTLAKSPPSDSINPGAIIPRVRYVIFRGMWGNAISDSRNEAEANPKVYESDCIMVTTDARMEKSEQIQETLEKQGEASKELSGTGGGNPVEAAFWVEDVKTQWRIRGDAWVMGPDIDEDSRAEVKEAKKALQQRMRVKDGMEKEKQKWSWAKELTFVFGAQSPDMRGSYANPLPGKPMKEDEDFRPTQPVEELDHAEARKNFRVVVIRPFEVEELDLNSPAKRFRHTFQDDGSWKTAKARP